MTRCLLFLCFLVILVCRCARVENVDPYADDIKFLQEHKDQPNFHPAYVPLGFDYARFMRSLLALSHFSALRRFKAGKPADTAAEKEMIYKEFLPGIKTGVGRISLSDGSTQSRWSGATVTRVCRKVYEPFMKDEILLEFGEDRLVQAQCDGMLTKIIYGVGQKIPAFEGHVPFVPVVLTLEFGAEKAPVTEKGRHLLKHFISPDKTKSIFDLYATDPKYRPLKAPFELVEDYHLAGHLTAQDVYSFARSESARAARRFGVVEKLLLHQILVAFYPGSHPHWDCNQTGEKVKVHKVLAAAGRYVFPGDFMLQLKKNKTLLATSPKLVIEVMVKKGDTVKPGGGFSLALQIPLEICHAKADPRICVWFSSESKGKPIEDIPSFLLPPPSSSSSLSPSQETGPDSRRISIIGLLNGTPYDLSKIPKPNRPLRPFFAFSPSRFRELLALELDETSEPVVDKIQPSCLNAQKQRSTLSKYTLLYERFAQQMKAKRGVPLEELQGEYISRLQLFKQKIPDCMRLLLTELPVAVKEGQRVVLRKEGGPMEALIEGIAVRLIKTKDDACDLFIFGIICP